MRERGIFKGASDGVKHVVDGQLAIFGGSPNEGVKGLKIIRSGFGALARFKTFVQYLQCQAGLANAANAIDHDDVRARFQRIVHLPLFFFAADEIAALDGFRSLTLTYPQLVLFYLFLVACVFLLRHRAEKLIERYGQIGY